MSTTEFKNNWAAIFPNSVPPAESQWALWLLLHDVEVVKKAMGQLAAKYRKLGGKMDTEFMVKFASSVMNRLSKEHKC